MGRRALKHCGSLSASRYEPAEFWDYPSFLWGTVPFVMHLPLSILEAWSASTKSALEGGHYRPEASWGKLQHQGGLGLMVLSKVLFLPPLPSVVGMGAYYVRAWHLGSWLLWAHDTVGSPAPFALW